jgi:hypothetical protein
MKVARLMLVAGSVSLAGCMSGVESAVFLPAPPSPREHLVRIYQTQAPSCPYEELGMVIWRPFLGVGRMQSGVNKMRDRVREMGGDAIVGFGIGERTNGFTTRTVADSTSVTTSHTVDRERMASGTVVRFTKEDCRS